MTMAGTFEVIVGLFDDVKRLLIIAETHVPSVP